MESKVEYLGIDSRKWAKTSAYSPSEDHRSSSPQHSLWWLKTTEKGFIMESHVTVESFDYSCPASSDLGKSRLKPYSDGRFFNINIINLNGNCQKELLHRNEISDKCRRMWGGKCIIKCERIEVTLYGHSNWEAWVNEQRSHTKNHSSLFYPKCLLNMRKISFLR